MKNRVASFTEGRDDSWDWDAAWRDLVKFRIRDVIVREDPQRPLCDTQIGELLRAEGLDVMRRTITKYRKQLGIRSSRQRGTV